MQRTGKPMLVTIGTTVADSTEIDMDGFAGGSFQLPAGSGTTQITPYARVGAESFGIAQDEDWIPEIPAAVTPGLPYPLTRFAYHYKTIKLVASAGVATQNVPVYLKS